jgi:hypothetical protein
MHPSIGILSAAAPFLRGAAWLTALLTSMSGAGGAGPFAGEKGTFGASLEFLAAHHQGPEEPGESNHFIELWQGRQTQPIATLHGLRDNHTLFINSHGGGFPTAAGQRHAFYPHESLLRKGQRAPRYSAPDIARVLGPAQAASIHNIVSGGCDREGTFSATELRRHFVNATNIVHVPAGQPGVQPMYFEAIVNRSSENKPFYEAAIPTGPRSTGYTITSAPSDHARRLAPYVAELFRPGEREPFRVQPAGRELLEPSFPAGSPSWSRQ